MRSFLDNRKKKNERGETSSSASQPCCVQVQLPDGRLGYRLWWYTGLSCLKQKGPELNEASTTPTCCYTQEKESPAVEENLPSSLTELSEEPPAVTNFSPDVELETINLSDDPIGQRPTSVHATSLPLEKAQLISLLKEYIDVFAWEYHEMLGLDPNLVSHALNVEPGAKLVVQPMRTFHLDVEAQIIQEIQKLLTAGFIKPIMHPRWLSNIVPIKKKNRQIRCCVDFKNLNKACPKDEFPLPNMDMLIDSVARHAMFSFMDGFSGYNQIRMTSKDAAKTAFRTPIGNFYDMIHKEIEDYMDDIVVKSKTRGDHLAILQKVFERCRLYKLRMNPLKCAFGVIAGKFLGFLVHQRGIDVDPSKVQAITTMKPPATLTQLKSFLGKLSYIRRFTLGLAALTAAFAP